MRITSPAFKQNDYLPAKYTCDGEDINPPLVIEGAPEGAKSLVLIIDDPDAVIGTFTHWLVYDIAPTVTEIKEKSIPGIEVVNTSGEAGYCSPCPPSGAHRYIFKIYALDIKIGRQGLDRADVDEYIKGHILAKAELTGLYKRH